MRRVVRLILLTAIFLGGYYVGHLPGSPDIFAKTAAAYRQVARTTTSISAKAEAEGVSLPRAAWSSLLEALAERCQRDPASSRAG